MHAPRTTPLHTAKCIFQYLQGALSYGLQFRPDTTPSIIAAYYNVDWAGCKDSYRSTTGYAVFFGPNLIS